MSCVRNLHTTNMLLRPGVAAAVPRVLGVRAAAGRVPACRRAQHTTAGAVQSWLDPIARYLVSVPETIGLLGAVPYPFTTSVVLMTLMLRAGVSVPMALWQRARTERLTNIVGPEYAVWKKQIPAAILSRAGVREKPPSEAQQVQLHREIQSALKEKWQHLVRLHDCSPWRTTGASLLVHIPLFLLVTALLRQAAVLPDSPLIQELIPWWSPDPAFAAQVATTKQLLVEKGLDPVSIERLTKIGGGPTLVDRDSTQIMPIVVGSLNMLNVELSQWVRQRRAAREQQLGLGGGPSVPTDTNGAPLPSLRERVLGNVLRTGAVVSIPIACSVPSVLLVYWTTSALVTMVQNSYFAWLDAKRT